jgi:hypothetical protein
MKKTPTIDYQNIQEKLIRIEKSRHNQSVNDIENHTCSLYEKSDKKSINITCEQDTEDNTNSSNKKMIQNKEDKVEKSSREKNEPQNEKIIQQKMENQTDFVKKEVKNKAHKIEDTNEKLVNSQILEENQKTGEEKERLVEYSNNKVTSNKKDTYFDCDPVNFLEDKYNLNKDDSLSNSSSCLCVEYRGNFKIWKFQDEYEKEFQDYRLHSFESNLDRNIDTNYCINSIEDNKHQNNIQNYGDPNGKIKQCEYEESKPISEGYLSQGIPLLYDVNWSRHHEVDNEKETNSDFLSKKTRRNMDNDQLQAEIEAREDNIIKIIKTHLHYYLIKDATENGRKVVNDFYLGPLKTWFYTYSMRDYNIQVLDNKVIHFLTLGNKNENENEKEIEKIKQKYEQKKHELEELQKVVKEHDKKLEEHQKVLKEHEKIYKYFYEKTLRDWINDFPKKDEIKQNIIKTKKQQKEDLSKKKEVEDDSEKINDLKKLEEKMKQNEEKCMKIDSSIVKIEQYFENGLLGNLLKSYYMKKHSRGFRKKKNDKIKTIKK